VDAGSLGLLLWNAERPVLFLSWMALPLAGRSREARGRLVAPSGDDGSRMQSNVLIAGLLLLAFSFLERRQMAWR
jgi:hypothetical protein